MTKSFTKRKAQIKSSRYYLFWGIATIAVVAGQIYVGTGYREMAEATKSTAISVTCATAPTSQAADKNRSFEFE